MFVCVRGRGTLVIQVCSALLIKKKNEKQNKQKKSNILPVIACKGQACSDGVPLPEITQNSLIF